MEDQIPSQSQDFRVAMLIKMVLTVDNLLKKGWSGDENCVLCLDEKETVDHLFFDCPNTTAMLKGLLPNKLFLNNRSSSIAIWKVCSLKTGAQGGKELAAIATTRWVICLERNRRIFQKSKRVLGCLLMEIRALRDSWERFCI